MHFETIRDFEWFNEPEFSFCNDGLMIKSAPCTDFWQDFRHNLSKDNGHFFFIRRTGDFCLNVKWILEKDSYCLGECGLMVRLDTKNWCKIALTKNETAQNLLIVSVTHQGCSDLAQVPLNGEFSEITYRIRAEKGIFQLSFSPDGDSFIPVRQFQFIKDCVSPAVGAYICCPQNNLFKAILADINFS